MATNGTLQLSTNYIQTGLGTLTFTVPLTLPPNNISVVNVPFTVLCQATFQQSVGEGFGAGSGADQGLGVTGTSPAYLPSYQTTGAQQGLGNGALGLGFSDTVPSGSFGGFDAGGSGGGSLGVVNDNASGSGSGYGAGAGGGTTGGFSLGGGGLGDGAKGQGFGASGSGYPQPPTFTNTPTSFAGVLSQLSILVKQNGTTVYTSPMIEGNQSALQFSTNLLCNASDVITVVFSSGLAADEALNALQANVAITVGEQ
jgi:hypothetical protein